MLFSSLKWRCTTNQPVYFNYKAILVFPLVYVIHHLLDQLNSPICLFLSLINNDHPDHFAWGKLTTLLLQGNISPNCYSALFKIQLWEKAARSWCCLKHILHLLKVFPDIFFLKRTPSLHALDRDLILSPHSFTYFSLHQFDTPSERILRKYLSILSCDELAPDYVSRPYREECRWTKNSGVRVPLKTEVERLGSEWF